MWGAGTSRWSDDHTATDVQKGARDLATKPFVPPKNDLPKALQEMTYDQYRDIRFQRERCGPRRGCSRWTSCIVASFLDPVMIYLVAEGHAQRVSYTRPLHLCPGTSPPAEGTVAGFSGFRVRAPLNRAEDDEFAVFQGASYFRAVARGQEYGLSARGLALNTAHAREEFPFFRTFWIERPHPRPASWWSMRSWTAPAPLGPIAGPYVRAIRRSWMSN